MSTNPDETARDRELAERRLEMEERLDEVRSAFDETLGWAPRAKAWLVPLLVGAAGLVGGMAVRRLARGRRARRLAPPRTSRRG